ncbi:hypothetical protein COUCH_15150 [Couchioplanes caeruleus]|uniref:hypothetical protein n=1 Tax=Couchioplanes caeruleus TaxID=56438 RepID=UPI0020BF25CA|nr:hypothetical protein [Couchioplanes caeruleus]UQU67520.1 hypothetical protein COUCH_15150 [Couchioplanes caeruleus]
MRRRAVRQTIDSVLINVMLTANLNALRKQQYTGAPGPGAAGPGERRGWLVVRGGARLRRVRHRELVTQAGAEPAEVFIVQTHRPGEKAEVDFGELWVRLAGVSTKIYLPRTMARRQR